MERQHVLWISCPGQTGLVYQVTGTLFRRDLNIVENAETVDRVTGTFFMRTEFSGDLMPDDLLTELRSLLPWQAQIKLRRRTPRKVVILGTREPHCVWDLLLRRASGKLHARIVAVISQYDALKGLAERFGIPFHHVPVERYDRERHKRELLDRVSSYELDYLVLAKYMRILSAGFVERFTNRIINIHHSFLPAFIGSNPYRQAYERGFKIISVTLHFVNSDLDDAPIITQSVGLVDHGHGPAEMARARLEPRPGRSRVCAWPAHDRIRVRER